MSKIKDYMDRKSKAIHRTRRSETEHKKDIRRSRIKNNEYGGFYGSRGWCGYYMYKGICYCIDNEGNRLSVCWYDDDKLFKTSAGMSYSCDDGMLRKVVGIREKHIKKINHGNGKKYYRHLASRKVRRKAINEECSILKGGNFKKEYDVAWLID